MPVSHDLLERMLTSRPRSYNCALMIKAGRLFGGEWQQGLSRNITAMYRKADYQARMYGQAWIAPVLLVAGESDHITSPRELEKIAAFLGKSHPVQPELGARPEPIIDSAAPVDLSNGAQPKPARREVDSLQDEDFAEKEPLRGCGKST